MSRQLTKAEFNSIVKWGHDRTSNGVYFEWWLAGPDGASFSLIREPQHTDEDIAKAKRELRNDRDVVSLSVAYYDPAIAAEGEK